jgi:hypothetical protein
LGGPSKYANSLDQAGGSKEHEECPDVGHTLEVEPVRFARRLDLLSDSNKRIMMSPSLGTWATVWDSGTIFKLRKSGRGRSLVERIQNSIWGLLNLNVP